MHSLQTTLDSSSSRTLFLQDSKQGVIWKDLEWKKVIAGYIKRGTLLKISDCSAPSRQTNSSRTVSISAYCYSKEMAMQPLMFEGLKSKNNVSYYYVMAIADQRGDVFVLDFMKNKYWLIARTGVTVTSLRFNSVRRRELLVGLADHSIYCYNIDTRILLAKLPMYHQAPPVEISVHPTKSLAISTSVSESLLWDTNTWERKRLLEGFGPESVQQTDFTPDGLMICAAFEDGGILFWSVDSFALIWKITLSNLSKTPEDSEFINHLNESLKLSRKTYFDLSFNGELFVYGGLSSTLYVWNLFEKRLLHEILIPSFNSNHLIQIAFLGHTDILAVLSASGDLVFINATTAVFVSQLRGKQPFQSFSISPDGQCLSTVSVANKHIVSMIRLDQVFHPEPEKQPSQAPENTSFASKPGVNADPTGERTYLLNTNVEKKTASRPKTFYELVESREESSLFNKSKLRSFLNHYGTFPDKYRPLIWRYLLQLPENRAGYEALSDQGLHPSFYDFRTKYPLNSDRAAKSMERMLSSLAYWSPIFEDLEYLPSLVYPFVKLFWNDLFSCLEVIMTVLMNWCQKWWEYYPNPPVEALEIVSSMLEYHDPQLFAHFQRCSITSQTYAWSLMKTLFSEAFSKQDWLKVWDHLIFNPPSFLYHFLIAYVIHFRKPLLGISNLRDFEFFFQKRNATNTNNLILKAYEIKSKTPTSLDPSTFLKSFNPCPPGEYPIFNQYPQFIVNHQLRMKNKIREDEEEFIQKRQLATELGRLNEELRREKHIWELRDRKMNESMQKWWSQIKKTSRVDTMNSARAELDVMTQVNEARKQIFASNESQKQANPKLSPTHQTRSREQDAKTFDESFNRLSNEWVKRKEEMRKVREELEKVQKLKAEQLVSDAEKLAKDSSNYGLGSNVVDQLNPSVESLSLSRQVQPSEISPTKSARSVAFEV